MSGIETAARVAALRERAARARFAAAGLRASAAVESERESRLALAGLAGPVAGGTDELHAWRAGAQLRAGAVLSAGTTVTETAEARTAALQEWQETSRRREALDEVLVRWRQAQQAKTDAAAQRLMDDLARRREAWA